MESKGWKRLKHENDVWISQYGKPPLPTSRLHDTDTLLEISKEMTEVLESFAHDWIGSKYEVGFNQAKRILEKWKEWK